MAIVPASLINPEDQLINLIRKEELHHINILFAGIGNVLRQDDGVGVYISERIRPASHIHSLNVEVSLENYVGKINKLNPDLLILVDCMHLNQAPGSWTLIEIDKIADQTFNTHNITLNRLAYFFKMPVVVLGIQPFTVDFGEILSPAVKEAAEHILCIINEI